MIESSFLAQASPGDLSAPQSLHQPPGNPRVPANLQHGPVKIRLQKRQIPGGFHPPNFPLELAPDVEQWQRGMTSNGIPVPDCFENAFPILPGDLYELGRMFRFIGHESIPLIYSSNLLPKLGVTAQSSPNQPNDAGPNTCVRNGNDRVGKSDVDLDRVARECREAKRDQTATNRQQQDRQAH